MAAKTVVVTAHVPAGVTGYLAARLTQAVFDQSTGLQYGQAPLSRSFDRGGGAALSLIDVTDANVYPTGALWEIWTEEGGSSTPPQYYRVAYANGAQQDISTMTPATVPVDTFPSASQGIQVMGATRVYHGTATQWTAANPILSAGDEGIESDTGLRKLGDGSTAWTSLAYTTATAGLPGLTLPHSPATGLTANLSVRASTVTVRDEKLNAVEAGYLVQGSGADQHAGLQSFATAIGTAIGGRGGNGVIPSGLYHMGSGSIAYPSGVTCGIDGESPPASYGTGTSGVGGTVLVWDSDIAGGADSAWGITLGGSGGMQQSLRRMTLEGPGSFFVSHPGIRPARLGAINARENNVLEDLNIENFSSGVGWGGAVGGAQSYDHSQPRNLRIGTCGYAFHFLAGNSGGGDFNAYGCNLNGTLAAIGIAQGCSTGLNGSSWVGCGLYGPIGIHRYGDTSGIQGNLVDATQFMNTSFENNGVAAIYDEQWQSGTLGSFIQFSKFSNGFGWRAPNASFAQWSATFSVSTSSGTSLTLTDGTGFVFRPGMTVTGTGIPANTVINSVAGSWPWSTVVLTLNNSVTSPTSVVVGQPLLATWVAYHINDNDISGPALGESTPGYPLVCCGFFGRNRVKDGTGLLSRAANGPLIIGTTGGGSTYAWGNTLGDSGDNGCLVLGSGIPAGGAVAAGDVVMTKSNANGQIQKCDASRRPLGVAIRANNASSNGNIDYLVRASFDNAGTTIPVNNYTASSIAAGALVKVDSAHPGGVTTATSPNDGWVIGVNGTSAIAATSSGTLAELWL